YRTCASRQWLPNPIWRPTSSNSFGAITLLMNPIAIIASTIEAVAALSMSAVRSLLYFLAKPTTASLVVSRNNNPVIPFVIFLSLALFPLVIFANIDLNELDSLEPVAPLIHRIKIADLGAAILYFVISYPLVNVVSYSLKKKKYIFRSITRAVQNIFGFTLFVGLAGTIFTMAVLRPFLVFQEESSLMEHPSFLNYVLTFAWTGLMMIFLGLFCYRLIYRSKTQILNRVVATGGSVLLCGIFFLSVNLSAYFYPSSKSRHLVESFKCLANDRDLNVRVVLKNDTDKSVFIDRFLVLVKDTTALSNDVAKG